MPLTRVEHQGKSVVAWVDGNTIYDLSEHFASLSDAIEHNDVWELVQNVIQAATPTPLSQVHLQAPVDPWTRIFLVAANYRPHAEEAGLNVPDHPLFFTKYPETFVGPGEPITLSKITDQLDYEGELAVVIGKSGQHVSADEAMNYVAGYTIVNDVTARDLQWTMLGKNRVVDWLSSKMLDKSSCIGPWVVPASSIPEPHQLNLRTQLNGKTMQNSGTSLMVFRIPELIEYLSARVGVRPGDIIATGTPFGVGGFRQIFLREGDTVEVTIDGIGTLTNRVSKSKS